MAELVEVKRATSAGRWGLLLMLLSAMVAAASVVIPLFVIRPFRPQGPTELAVAFAVRRVAPWVTATCAAGTVLAAVASWGRIPRVWQRITVVGFCSVALAAACLSRVNVFEKMFHPYETPMFGSVAEVPVDLDDKVLAVRIKDEAKAFPIRTMGYHHIVNDTIGGRPVAVTYCTLCHTGLVWSRVVGGKTLRFRLAGINNGNALLQDRETESIWQQSTGEAIFGPLKGQRLELIPSDELTVALWRREEPDGMILRPDDRRSSEYDPKDWESQVEQTRVVVDTTRSGIPPHRLMLGVSVDGVNKAYPVDTILTSGLIEDRVGGGRVLLVVGQDGSSIRVFKVQTVGRDTALTFARLGGARDKLMVDTQTSSEWNFKGCAIKGLHAGQCLVAVESHKDYWFDWMNHHPDTAVFKG